jgi:hypothetical protein
MFAYLRNSDHSLKRHVVVGRDNPQVRIVSNALTYLVRQPHQKLAILSWFPILSLALGPHSQT